MNSTALDAAYDQLLTAAEAISATSPLPADARQAIDWTLSHLALSDHILAAAARDVLTGRTVVVDNRAAMDGTAIASVIDSTTHAERCDLVRRNAADLTALNKAIPDEAATTPVRVRLVNRDGQPVPEQQLPWTDLVRLRATEHLPGHAARLRALASRT